MSWLRDGWYVWAELQDLGFWYPYVASLPKKFLWGDVLLGDRGHNLSEGFGAQFARENYQHPEALQACRGRQQESVVSFPAHFGQVMRE
jgi:hypothetical protein